jgi:hypothetical protein
LVLHWILIEFNLILFMSHFHVSLLTTFRFSILFLDSYHIFFNCHHFIVNFNFLFSPLRSNNSDKVLQFCFSMAKKIRNQRLRLSTICIIIFCFFCFLSCFRLSITGTHSYCCWGYYKYLLCSICCLLKFDCYCCLANFGSRCCV